jgi:RNA polymerase sigma factor (TIGR02999 family)
VSDDSDKPSDDPAAPGPFDAMISAQYPAIRELAGALMRGERADHTLQPTELANEVYLRLRGSRRVEVRTRLEFMSLVAQAMRHHLVDYARNRGARKRQGAALRVTLSEAITETAVSRGEDLIALDEAMRRLAATDEVVARILELHYFGGLKNEEIGELLGRSEKWVRNQTRFGRAWLRREMSLVP